MKSVFLRAALACFITLCDAGSTYELHETRSSHPKSWLRSNRVENDAILPIRIALTQTNLENAEAYLMDV
jgi:tripeptidyl-peptidase-1